MLSYKCSQLWFSVTVADYTVFEGGSIPLWFQCSIFLSRARFYIFKNCDSTIPFFFIF